MVPLSGAHCPRKERDTINSMCNIYRSELGYMHGSMGAMRKSISRTFGVGEKRKLREEMLPKVMRKLLDRGGRAYRSLGEHILKKSRDLGENGILKHL